MNTSLPSLPMFSCCTDLKHLSYFRRAEADGAHDAMSKELKVRQCVGVGVCGELEDAGKSVQCSPFRASRAYSKLNLRFVPALF